jgi:hypothetical protein
MHEEQWDGTEYSLYSTRIEPKGPNALPPPMPEDEFTLGKALGKTYGAQEEYTGLFGFVAKSFRQGLFPDTNSLGKHVNFQGSRQMSNFSRRYYEKEMGAGIGPSPGFTEHFGYTEPFRRFVQREDFSSQANEIPNTAASWLPGDDYYTRSLRPAEQQNPRACAGPSPVSPYRAWGQSIRSHFCAPSCVRQIGRTRFSLEKYPDALRTVRPSFSSPRPAGHKTHRAPAPGNRPRLSPE